MFKTNEQPSKLIDCELAVETAPQLETAVLLLKRQLRKLLWLAEMYTAPPSFAEQDSKTESTTMIVDWS